MMLEAVEEDTWSTALGNIVDASGDDELPWFDALEGLCEEEEEHNDDNTHWVDALEGLADKEEEDHVSQIGELQLVPLGEEAAPEHNLETAVEEEQSTDIQALVLSSKRTDNIDATTLRVCNAVFESGSKRARRYVNLDAETTSLNVDRRQLRAWKSDMASATLSYERLMFDKLQEQLPRQPSNASSTWNLQHTTVWVSQLRTERERSSSTCQATQQRATLNSQSATQIRQTTL
jgi:hypothetical protein